MYNLIRVLLLSYIYRLSIELESVNEPLRLVKLFFWLLEVGKDLLDLLNYYYVATALILQLLKMNFKYACTELRNHE